MASSESRRRRGPAMLPPDTDILQFLLGLGPEDQEEALRRLGMEDADAFDRAWNVWAHEGQLPPAACADGSDWTTCVIMGGRGFGKTRAGAEWIVSLLKADEETKRPNRRSRLRIALVGATIDDARGVMVEGPSGLLEVAGPWIRAWHPSLHLLKFRTGAEARLFSGHTPELLRGPQHHFAWCDELAKWEKPQETWDMLWLGLRCAARPRIVATTTPRPGPVLKTIMAEPDCVTIGGPTDTNPHNSPAWLRKMKARYAGTRLEKQELHGQLLTDNPGALWTEELLEKCRLNSSPSLLGEGDHAQHGGGVAPDESNTFVRAITRLVVAVDPPSGDGTCGIVACAKDSTGRAHVLADHSVAARTPEGWSRTVADAASLWTRLHPNVPLLVVAEQNQGGLMVQSVLKIADPALRLKLVTATQGKTDRAAPVAMLFEAGRVALHGRFPELEAELCGMIAGGDYEGPGTSPDRADAMVWGLTELMLQKERAAPRIRTL